MIIATADTIEGVRIKKVIGLVKGNTVRSRFFIMDWIAAFKISLGGEVHEYTQLLAQSREQAIDRMIEDAEAKGANAIVAMRLTTSSIAQNAAELLAYGTAVEVEQEYRL